MIQKIVKKFILLVALFILLLGICWGVRLYTLVRPEESFPLSLKWQVDLGHSTYERPAYQDGLVLLPANNIFSSHWYGIDITTGQVAWSQRIRRNSFRRCLTAEHLVVSNPSSLFVLKTRTGEIIWEGERGWSATCSEEAVFSTNNTVGSIIRVLNLKTGQNNWLGEKPRKPFGGLIYDYKADKLIAKETSLSEHLYIVDPKSGKLLHFFEEVGQAPSDGRWRERGPMYLVDRGELFIGGTVLNANTGQVIHKEDRYSTELPPTVTEDTMYISSSDVVALDRSTYNIKWVYQSQPKFQWLPLYTLAPITILDKTGYVIFSDATLRAFDLETGRELGYWQPGLLDLWSWPICGLPPVLGCSLSARAGLTSSNNTLFVSFGDGKLYAFEK